MLCRQEQTASAGRAYFAVETNILGEQCFRTRSALEGTFGVGDTWHAATASESCHPIWQYAGDVLARNSVRTHAKVHFDI